jgi:uncharacterized protein YqjF (DUF2071 family)
VLNINAAISFAGLDTNGRSALDNKRVSGPSPSLASEMKRKRRAGKCIIVAIRQVRSKRKLDAFDSSSSKSQMSRRMPSAGMFLRNAGSYKSHTA